MLAVNTRQLLSLTSLGCLTVLLAAQARAQVPPPRVPSPPINDPPPPSPIDGPRRAAPVQVEKQAENKEAEPPRPPAYGDAEPRGGWCRWLCLLRR